MDEDRTTGTERNVGGKAQETFRRAIGESTAEARDSVSDAAESARETGSSIGRQLGKMIEQQPYTAVTVALGIGWLLGRSHRPL